MSDSCVTNKASFSEVLKLRCSFYHFLLLLWKQENYSYSVSPTNPFYSTAKSDIRETDGFFETPPEFLMLVSVNTNSVAAKSAWSSWRLVLAACTKHIPWYWDHLSLLFYFLPYMCLQLSWLLKASLPNISALSISFNFVICFILSDARSQY